MTRRTWVFFRAGQALEDAAVLAVHGDDPGPRAGGFLAEQGAADDDGLLIGQGDALAGPDRSQGRPESIDPGDGRDNGLRADIPGDLFGSVRAEDEPESPAAGQRAEGVCVPLRFHGNEARPVPFDLPDEQGQVRAGGQRRHVKPAGQAVDDIQGARPDRAGRAQDGDRSDHGSPQLTSRNT